MQVYEYDENESFIVTAIDPGSETGVAMLKDGHPVLSRTLSGCDPENVIWKFLLGISMDEMNKMNLTEGVHHIVIEIPDSWTREGKNVADILGVIATAYTLYGWFCSQDVDVTMIPVSKWKGRTSKKTMSEEFTIMAKAEGWTIAPASSHEIDAIRLGLWWWNGRMAERKMYGRKESNV